MFETKMKRASVPARPDQKVRYSPYPVYWIVGGYWFRSNTKGRRSLILLASILARLSFPAKVLSVKEHTNWI